MISEINYTITKPDFEPANHVTRSLHVCSSERGVAEFLDCLVYISFSPASTCSMPWGERKSVGYEACHKSLSHDTDIALCEDHYAMPQGDIDSH